MAVPEEVQQEFDQMLDAYVASFKRAVEDHVASLDEEAKSAHNLLDGYNDAFADFLEGDCQ